MLALVNCVVALSMIFIAPGSFPEFIVVGGDQATLAAGGHDLVLAKGKRVDVTHGAYGPSFVARAVGLRAILHDLQIVFARQSQDGIHVAGPAREVNSNDRLGPRP